jgi:hypothetical protein
MNLILGTTMRKIVVGSFERDDLETGLVQVGIEEEEGA